MTFDAVGQAAVTEQPLKVSSTAQYALAYELDSEEEYVIVSVASLTVLETVAETMGIIDSTIQRDIIFFILI